MKKILELCLSPDLGGLELHMKNLALHLNSFCVIGNNSKLEPFLKKDNLEYEKISRYDFFKLAKIIDKNSIDIIHLHWTKDIPVVVLAKLLSKRKPKIVQTRHMHMTRFKSDFYHKFMYKNIDTIIAVTNLVKQQLIEFIPQSVRPQIQVCYIGAQTPKTLSIQDQENLKNSFNIKDEFLVCIVGRIEEAKGQHIVLDAVEKLRNNNINAKALIVGHFMDENYFTSLKTSYPNDIFTGFVNNPTELMQLADCVVLATKKETFGLVLIEAMKCGICVIGSNSGGPLEIIDDGENGLLFESMNSQDLYQKLLLIANDVDMKNTLANNGKTKADEVFDSEKQFGKIRNILENL
ncbi:glycosyltransferase family 4 protein [Arcobacter sp. FWKO B]|uniref:glycosyltransferase family 4 protein n=1 Tax=Arcobacter sp. FWKO B TaxID=2593672 RepID=UPI0018A42AC9|nr:glycosyltransferase family 4 protein [Arcobacter sp. FWKO B]QOG11493.1 glycosyltransferase family 4 protein [Arcobacter sp. FWKO B]